MAATAELNPYELIEAIRSLPRIRMVNHCGHSFPVPIFDIYATCPACGEEIKVRSFGAAPEVEDVFDAVFEWTTGPDAQTVAEERVRFIAADQEN